MNNLKKASTVLLFMIFSATVECQQIETILQAGHYSAVTAVCYSADGRFIATGSRDKIIILWRSSDGKEIRTFRGSASAITWLEFSSDGRKLLSLNEAGELILWDVSSGKVLLKKKQEDDYFSCASLNNEGTRIVTGSKMSGIAIRDAITGETIIPLKTVPQDNAMEKGFDYPETRTVKFSADGNYIVTGTGDYTSILYDAKTGAEIRKYKKLASTCTSCESEAIISSDNKYIFNASSDSIKMFDLKSGKLVRQFYGQGGDPENLQISYDNRFISAIEYGNVEVWEVNTGKLILKDGEYNENKILCAAISPDCRQIITGSEKRVSDILEISTGKKLLTLKGYLNQVDERILSHSYMYWAALINEARLSPDGNYIAVGRTGNNVKIIDFKTGKIFRTLAGHKAMVISLCFSNDGKYLATGGLDGQAIVWDVASGSIVRKISSPDESMPVFSVDISSDGKMLATADWGGYVTIYDIISGEMLRAVSPHDKTGVYQVKFSSNGVYFISAGLDGKLKMTEIDSGEEVRVFKGHNGLVSSINLNPEGDRIITSAWDGTLRIWDFLSGIQVLKIRAHEGGAYCGKYDPSGKYIISGGDDFLVKEWDARTGALVTELPGHHGQVGDVNITADLKHIISGSRDGSVRIWDVPGKKELVSLVFMNENDWFIRNPAGYFDASEGAFGSISFVKGTELYSIGQFFNEFYRPGLYAAALSEETTSFRQDVSGTIEKYPPPTAQFVIPENNLKTDNPAVTCMVRITNNGGGVKELRVMQNGKRQIVDASDLLRMSKKGQEAMKTFDIMLVPGNNEISVSAFSNGDIECVPQTLNIFYNGIQKSSDCYVLSVGINKYQNENLNLAFARSDAQDFAEFMNSKAEKLFNNMHSVSLVDGNATKEKILSAIAEMSKTMKKEDVFIFFYAGHGSTFDNIFYFITSEVTGLYQQDKLKNALSVIELQEKFRILPALKQVLFVDACHSGSSVEALAMRGSTEEKALAQLSRSSGVHVMASSDSEQQSAEIKSLGHGVFTYVLLEALRGKADGAPADSKVTVYEIKSYLDDQVPEMSYNLIRHKQFPSTFSIGHDFPLVIE
jgi:WD40 repeat protein